MVAKSVRNRMARTLLQISYLALMGAVVWAMPAAEACAQAGRGPRGPGQRNDQQFRADQEIFRFLLDNRQKIRREVTRRDDGVVTLTESDDPAVANKIQEHVSAMYRRVKDDKPIHRRDPLFDALFQHADKINFKAEKTKKGIKVTESSDDPHVVELIQAHADVVSLFLKNGHAEVRKNHAVPKPPKK